MSDRWKHDNWHTNPQQPDEHCPYCHIRALEAQLARVRELPKNLIKALSVAADALEIASDHNIENVQVWPPDAWNLPAINEDSAEGWCSTYALAVRLREVATALEAALDDTKSAD